MSDRRGRGVSNRYKPDRTIDNSESEGARWRLLVFLVIVSAVFGYGGYAAITAESFDAGEAEAAAIELVNDARQEEGLPALETDAELKTYATEWSNEMAKTGFRHGEPMCRTGGENIAYRGEAAGSATETGEAIAQQWLNSPQHRKQIMSQRWDQQAVGIVKSDGGVYATQQFC